MRAIGMSVEAISWALNLVPVPRDRGETTPANSCPPGMASPTGTNLQALSRLDRAVPGQGLEPMKSLRRSCRLPAFFSKAGTIRGGTLRLDSRSARDRSAGPAQSAIAARQYELAGAGSPAV